MAKKKTKASESYERKIGDSVIILCGWDYHEGDGYIMDGHIAKFLPTHRIVSHDIDHFSSRYQVIMESRKSYPELDIKKLEGKIAGWFPKR